MTNFLAYNSRWRVALLILASIAFVFLGLWMGGAFGDVPTSRHFSAGATIGVGWFCVLFFGLCAVAGTKKFFDDSVQLEVGPFGVRWSSWSDQTVPWSEITEVTTWSYMRQKAIILHMNDRARFPARGMTAKLAGANRMLTGGDIAISLTGTDRSYEEALEAIGRFRRAAS